MVNLNLTLKNESGQDVDYSGYAISTWRVYLPQLKKVKNGLIATDLELLIQWQLDDELDLEPISPRHALNIWVQWRNLQYLNSNLYLILKQGPTTFSFHEDQVAILDAQGKWQQGVDWNSARQIWQMQSCSLGYEWHYAEWRLWQLQSGLVFNRL
jgi:hypothetical protein